MSKKLFCLLVICFAPFSVLANSNVPLSIPEFSATYHVQKLGMKIGELNTQLYQQSDGNYVYEANSKTTGILSVFRKDRVHEKSIWQYKGGKILPLSFLYKQTGRRARHIVAEFNWKDMNYIKKNKGRSSKQPLPPGTLDHQLYQIALMLDAKKHPQTLQYSILDRRSIEVYQFTFEGEEEISTQLGSLKTLKYRRNRRNSKRQTLLWMARQYHYLPVKILHIEKNGSKFFVKIQSIKGLTPSQK